MKIKQALAAVTLVGTIALALPAAPASANGAASTRNLILLGGAATYLIIQHNRKVHEKYAQDARRQAALQSENNDAWAAYHQEQRAYEQEALVNSELKKEIAYQHKVVLQQRQELASLGMRGSFVDKHVAMRNHRTRNAHARVARAPQQQVAMVSYGWGSI